MELKKTDVFTSHCSLFLLATFLEVLPWFSECIPVPGVRGLESISSQLPQVSLCSETCLIRPPLNKTTSLYRPLR